MRPEEAKLLEVIAAAARDLPRSVVEELCDALEDLADDTSSEQRASLPAKIASPAARTRVRGLVEAWGSAPKVSPANLAWALRAASEADERRRREQTVELVWTGPSPRGTVFRRTDQVLLELIRSARRTLHIVTFAAYKIPLLNEAMLAAAGCGVELSFVFESPDAGKLSFDATRALGEELRSRSNVYVWPPDKRPSDTAGRYGSLHAKFAVADTDAVLISSANLTEYALALNMELGLLVRGGGLPSRVVGHLQRLMNEGTLVPV